MATGADLLLNNIRRKVIKKFRKRLLTSTSRPDQTAETSSIMETELKTKSVKDLKAILKSFNVSAVGCVEKSDLVKRVAEAQKAAKKEKASGKPFTETISGFKCISMQTDEKPEILIYVFHGFGANAENLADIGSELIKKGKVGSKKVRVVCVNAPLQMHQDSYAWWPLDMQELMTKMFTLGPVHLFKGNKPKEMKSTVSKVEALIAEDLKNFELKMSNVVLTGFSQGSWLATHLGLSMKEAPKGLVIYSGAMYCEEWAAMAKERKGLPVLQFHGTQDIVLPFQQAKILNETLKGAGLQISFHTFAGGHTISPDAIPLTDKFLLSLLK
ncbi:hypothetical protein AAMO2058_000051500 [Amorphochlora amoebiformis]